MHRLQEFVRLHRQGRSSREVAHLLRMSRKTIRRYARALAEAGLLEGCPSELPEVGTLTEAIRDRFPTARPPQQSTSVSRWLPAIECLVLEKSSGPTAIYDLLRLEHPEFDGSLSAVKRACAQILKNRPIQPGDVTMPVETVAGDVAQVDFGYVGKLHDPDRGRLRRAWLFALTLGFSRHTVARIVFDQKAETWIRLHVECLRELGGVPRTVVPDNLKAAIVRAAFGAGEDALIHRSYRELARHYGFEIDPTPPRSPEKKGKVERTIQYIKRNFFATRDFIDVRAARRELQRWLVEIAGQRRHGTTGRKPIEMFELEEKPALQPLAAARFELVTWKQARLHRDCHVIYGREFYSAPWRLVGQKLDLRVTQTSVAIYHDTEHLWTHDRVAPGRRSTVESHLPEGRRNYRHRTREYWIDQARKIGKPVAELAEAIFQCDDVLCQLRKVQAIVTHLAQHPAERACAAAARALHFGAMSYPAIKDILRKGLDMQPLPDARQGLLSWESRPRFSRVPPRTPSHDNHASTDAGAQEAPAVGRPAEPGSPGAAGH